MSKNKDLQTAPNLRFKGFTDDWEQRKLGDIVNISSGWAPSNFKEYNSEGNLFIKVDDLNYSNRIQNDSKMKVAENLKYKKMAKGSTIFPKRGAAIMTNKVRILGEDSYMDTNMMALEAVEIDSNFLYTFINRTGLFKIADTSTIPQINNKHIEPYQVKLPRSEEQLKIGLLFKRLDNTITLHQRKLDQLNQLKEALLQQMFPGKGETVPKLRFAGFKGDWEELKLGEYTNYRRGSFPQPYGNKEWYGGENAMPFVQVVDVSNNLKLEPKTKQNISSIAQPKSVFVSSGTVVVTLQGSIGRVAITQYDSYVDRTLLIFEDYVRKTDKYFWGYTIQNKFNIEKEKAPGGTIKTITKAALSQFVVSIPLYGEQDKLGTFLKNIDTTITLQQRKLDQLQNMKQVLLENMFI
ncbi:restriction endonuclease subunit S [Aerococcus viridans]